MFAYCGNNPIIRKDDTGFTGESVAGWSSTMWWLTLTDGFLPIGDIIYLGGMLLLSAVEVINTIGIDNLGHAVEVSYDVYNDLVQKVNSASSGSPPNDPRFRSFTKGNFRYNLSQLTGQSGQGMQAHHVFPQKFVSQFKALGINIHDPRFGSWVDSSHQSWSAAYNRAWVDFFQTHSNPTYSQAVAYARVLSKAFGFDVNF